MNETILQLADDADQAMATWNVAYHAMMTMPANTGSIDRVEINMALSNADNRRIAADARLSDALLEFAGVGQ